MSQFEGKFSSELQFDTSLGPVSPVPVLSVIIAARDSADTIERCLASLRSESSAAIETILVDNSSEDDTRKIAERIQSDTTNLRILEETQRGQSAARNKGLSSARGRYVFFLDSDDALIEDAWRDLLRIAEGAEEDVLLLPALQQNPSQGAESFQLLGPPIQITGVVSGMAALQQMSEEGVWNPSPAQYLFQRDFLVRNRIQFSVGTVYEDNIFALLALACASSVRTESKAIAKIFLTTESTVRSSVRSFHVSSLRYVYDFFSSWDGFECHKSLRPLRMRVTLSLISEAVRRLGASDVSKARRAELSRDFWGVSWHFLLVAKFLKQAAFKVLRFGMNLRMRKSQTGVKLCPGLFTGR